MKNIHIILDNGHGVNTKGKRSPDGRLREYAYTRLIVKRIHTALTARGYNVHILVPEEADISLGQRCARANALCDLYGKQKCILVSVHVNAAGNGDWMNAKGWEAWTSPGTTKSDVLAECLYKSARRTLPSGTPIRTDTTDGDSDKEARFQILMGTRCPAVLTENLFQDNRKEVEWLLSEEGMAAITALHVDGIINYINSL